MVTQNNRNVRELADQRLIDGMKKHEQALGSLLIGGATYKAADLTPVLQARIDSGKRALAARAAWLEAVQADKDERTKSKKLVAGLRQALKVAFGSSTETLADFGLTPRKTAVVSPDQRVAATAKAKATRSARHTMGPKQKKSVKGAVDVAVVVTPSAGSQPAPSPAPATPSTPAGNAPAGATPTASAPGGNAPSGSATPHAT